jgi:hypothetical protein
MPAGYLPTCFIVGGNSPPLQPTISEEFICHDTSH